MWGGMSSVAAGQHGLGNHRDLFFCQLAPGALGQRFDGRDSAGVLSGGVGARLLGSAEITDPGGDALRHGGVLYGFAG